MIILLFNYFSIMEIIFVRHGESTQNEAYKNNEEYDVNNIVLTKLGTKQANKTGKYLNIYGKYDAIFSSLFKYEE